MENEYSRLKCMQTFTTYTLYKTRFVSFQVGKDPESHLLRFSKAPNKFRWSPLKRRAKEETQGCLEQQSEEM